MENEDVVKCPLCGGHGQLRRSEIQQAVADKALHDRLQGALNAASGELVGAGSSPRDFQKDVHTWNPTLPMWRRSPKE
ncbi:MAG TPA: hypothetical protein VLW84_07265 [Terriglobales bacterium]|nr:hypothetical protein [Terriglobales bacterium]